MGLEKCIQAYNKIKVGTIRSAPTCWRYCRSLWLHISHFRLYTRMKMRTLTRAPVWCWASWELSINICTPTSFIWWWQTAPTRKVGALLSSAFLLNARLIINSWIKAPLTCPPAWMHLSWRQYGQYVLLNQLYGRFSCHTDVITLFLKLTCTGMLGWSCLYNQLTVSSAVSIHH